MFDRKFLLIVLMTTATVIGFQLLNRGDRSGAANQAVQPGQSFKVPSQEELFKPVSREIDFDDATLASQEQQLHLKSPLQTLQFSSLGGSLIETTFEKRVGKSGQPLSTIAPPTAAEREGRSFLLAFGSKTPYGFEQASHQTDDGQSTVVYSTETSDWRIKKTYRLFHNRYVMDVELDFEPKRSEVKPLEPRLFIRGPYISELGDDAINAVTYLRGDISKVASSQEEEVWAVPQMFGLEDRYFAHVLINDGNEFVRRAYLKREGEHTLNMIFEGPAITGKSSYALSFYIGPKDYHDLRAADVRLEGLLQFGMLSWLCKWLLWLLEHIYRYLPNYGLAIIVLAILLKLPLLPLTIKGADVMEKHQKIQPQIAHLRKKYKADVQLQHQEIMRLYKEKGMSPFGQFLGCLPLLLQLPIIFSLYKVLGSYMDLYNAPLVFWISDLSLKDPYYILPILMGVTMLWQQAVSPMGGDDKAKMMMFLAPILMTGFFANLASGVVLYWLANNILAVGEAYLRQYLKRIRII